MCPDLFQPHPPVASDRKPAPSPPVPTRTISVPIPEAVFEGLLDAARQRGDKTITDAILAGVHLYMQDSLGSEAAQEQVLAARPSLADHLRQIPVLGS